MCLATEGESHLEVPGDEVQLLVWTQLLCHDAGPSGCLGEAVGVNKVWEGK